MLKTVTPAGSCPYKLTSTDKEHVHEWAQRVMEHGYQKGEEYLPSAIRYFARQFYDRDTEEYEIVCQHLEELLGSKSRSPQTKSQQKPVHKRKKKRKKKGEKQQEEEGEEQQEEPVQERKIVTVSRKNKKVKKTKRPGTVAGDLQKADNDDEIDMGE